MALISPTLVVYASPSKGGTRFKLRSDVIMNALQYTLIVTIFTRCPGFQPGIGLAGAGRTVCNRNRKNLDMIDRIIRIIYFIIL